jgi:hypothetical protein
VPTVVFGLSAASSFLIEYVVVLRGPANASYLHDFWENQFLRASSLPALVALVARRTHELTVFFAGYRAALGAALLAFYLVGCVAALLRRQGALFAGAAGPLLVAIGMALLQRYPYGGTRTNLFLLPSICLGVAAGVAWVWPSSFRRERAVAIVAGLAVACIGVQITRQHLRRPYEREELRGPIEAMKLSRRRGDFTYVYYGAKPAFRYYVREPLDGPTIMGAENREAPERYRDELERMFERSPWPSRWWVVFSHFGVRDDERNLIKQVFRERCRRGEKFTDYGADVTLYICGNPNGP